MTQAELTKRIVDLENTIHNEGELLTQSVERMLLFKSRDAETLQLPDEDLARMRSDCQRAVDLRKDTIEKLKADLAATTKELDKARAAERQSEAMKLVPGHKKTVKAVVDALEALLKVNDLEQEYRVGLDDIAHYVPPMGLTNLLGRASEPAGPFVTYLQRARAYLASR